MGPPTDAWRRLERELQAWETAGRSATLWWRDDDCVEPSAALDRLLAMALECAAPLALAVVPARMSSRLPLCLAACTAEVTVLQHGYAHRNHAPAARKRQELGPDRPPAAVLEELARGAAHLAGRFAPAAHLAVLVPPWNRIDPALIPGLAGLGFTGLSTDGPRAAAEAAPGLIQVNTHLDLLRTARRGGRLDPEAALDDLTGHLSARREGLADPSEPSGILSHHLVHDEAAWSLLGDLLGLLAGHGAVRLLGARDIFAEAGDGEPAPA